MIGIAYVLSIAIFIINLIHFGTSFGGRMKMTLDEEITNCGKKPWRFDLTDFELIMINDTTTMQNGTLVFLEGIDRPWKVVGYGEMYDRGQWHRMAERKFDDFCDYILKPDEYWYEHANKMFKGKRCPYPKGFKLDVNEMIINFDLNWLPPNFQGRWRLSFDDDGRCMRFSYDLNYYWN